MSKNTGMAAKFVQEMHDSFVNEHFPKIALPGETECSQGAAKRISEELKVFGLDYLDSRCGNTPYDEEPFDQKEMKAQEDILKMLISSVLGTIDDHRANLLIGRLKAAADAAYIYVAGQHFP